MKRRQVSTLCLGCLPDHTPTKFIVVMLGEKMGVCGTHANYWRHRGYTPQPVPQTK